MSNKNYVLNNFLVFALIVQPRAKTSLMIYEINTWANFLTSLFVKPLKITSVKINLFLQNFKHTFLIYLTVVSLQSK